MKNKSLARLTGHFHIKIGTNSAKIQTMKIVFATIGLRRCENRSPTCEKAQKSRGVGVKQVNKATALLTNRQQKLAMLNLVK